MVFELKDVSLFCGLDDVKLQLLQSQLLIKHYKKNSIVFYEDDESEYLHILLDGEVRLFKTSPQGKQVHIHNFQAPETIALFAAFERIPFPASCEFFTDGVLGLLPLKSLYNCLRDIDFSLAFISSLSKRIRLLSTLLHKETIFSSEAKIADLIYNNPKLFQHFKNNQIASILNITPETLSRILTKLKKENIITIEEHIVTILNPKALLSIIETNSIKKGMSN